MDKPFRASASRDRCVLLPKDIVFLILGTPHGAYLRIVDGAYDKISAYPLSLQMIT